MKPEQPPTPTDDTAARAGITALEQAIRHRTEQAAAAHDVMSAAHAEAEQVTAAVLADADVEARRAADQILAGAAERARAVAEQADRDTAALREAAHRHRADDVRALLDAVLPVAAGAGPDGR